MTPSEALHGPALLLQPGSQNQRPAGRLQSLPLLLLRAGHVQKHARQSAFLQLALPSSSAASTATISQAHAKAAPCEHRRHAQAAVCCLPTPCGRTCCRSSATRLCCSPPPRAAIPPPGLVARGSWLRCPQPDVQARLRPAAAPRSMCRHCCW